jgi:hypothetical protein
MSVLTQVEASTAAVLGPRHCFQMVGIAAHRNTAEMVDLQPLRDRPNEPLVREAMNSVRYTIDACVAVTLGGSTSPHPASARSNHAATHQCLRRKFGPHGSQYISVVP